MGDYLVSTKIYPFYGWKYLPLILMSHCITLVKSDKLMAALSPKWERNCPPEKGKQARWWRQRATEAAPADKTPWWMIQLHLENHWFHPGPNRRWWWHRGESITGWEPASGTHRANACPFPYVNTAVSGVGGCECGVKKQHPSLFSGGGWSLARWSQESWKLKRKKRLYLCSVNILFAPVCGGFFCQVEEKQISQSIILQGEQSVSEQISTHDRAQSFNASVILHLKME